MTQDEFVLRAVLAQMHGIRDFEEGCESDTCNNMIHNAERMTEMLVKDKYLPERTYLPEEEETE